jgi:hypothetical protein
MKFDRFDERLRIDVKQKELDFLVLKEVNKAAGELFRDISEKKAAKILPPKSAKTKVTDRLRWRSPW